MKKAAIMTINSLNFGNRLQNYALQKTIEQLGLKVSTIRRSHYVWDDKGVKEKLKDIIRYIVGSRKGAYLRFDRENIVFSRYRAEADTVDHGVEEKFDFFVTGSDQVWNPYYSHIVGKSDLLLFTKGAKRISYAASFGVDSIPEEQKQTYAEALKEFRAISVREKEAVKIVKELCGRDAALTLDPTLLLTADEWDHVARKPKAAPKGKYILLYCIGDIPDHIKKELREYKNRTGCAVYNILGTLKNGREVAAGPAEFLWLVKHAECVYTDSFHATVFSIIYRVKVRSFSRSGLDMSSRVRSLAEITGMQDHFDQKGVFFMTGEEDYAEIEKRLNLEKGHSIQYLKDALSQ